MVYFMENLTKKWYPWLWKPPLGLMETTRNNKKPVTAVCQQPLKNGGVFEVYHQSRWFMFRKLRVLMVLIYIYICFLWCLDCYPTKRDMFFYLWPVCRWCFMIYLFKHGGFPWLSPSGNRTWQRKIHDFSGGWATILKNHGVLQLGWWHSQLNGKS